MIEERREGGKGNKEIKEERLSNFMELSPS
jgi:hypothetical protein